MNTMAAVPDFSIKEQFTPTLWSKQTPKHELTALTALWEEPFCYVKQYAEALQNVKLGYFVSYFSQKMSARRMVALKRSNCLARLGVICQTMALHP